MNLHSIGKLVAEKRRAKRLTLREVAALASVGRSTLAALEAPLMAHRHITDSAARQLTKAAIEDVILRGDFRAWRGLIQTIRADKTGRLARRAREVAAASGGSDPKAKAFATLLPRLLKAGTPKAESHG